MSLEQKNIIYDKFTKELRFLQVGSELTPTSGENFLLFSNKCVNQISRFFSL